MENQVVDISPEHQIKILQEKLDKANNDLYIFDKDLCKQDEKIIDLETENILLKEINRDNERRIKIMENLADDKNLKIIKLEELCRQNKLEYKYNTITIPIIWTPPPIPFTMTNGCSICGLNTDEGHCLIAHAAHDNPNQQSFLISCPCPKCSPRC